MLGPTRAWFLLGYSLCSLALGCKDRGGQDSRPLPTPEPPASASPLPLPRDDAAPAPKKRAGDDELAKPKRPATETATEKADNPPSPGSGGAGSVATTTATAAGGSAAPAVSGLPVLTAPSAACLSRCQGAMQGCLSAPVDGGVPGFSNLELCKKAFEACQAACAKQ